jgi:hypothetical protein
MNMRRQSNRHRCAGCNQRRALFCMRGRWKADNDHDLCVACFRSHLDRSRPRDLSVRGGFMSGVIR